MARNIHQKYTHTMDILAGIAPCSHNITDISFYFILHFFHRKRTSVLETSVASFAARTANQIERLRLSQNKTSIHANHRSGIISCLLLSLRMDVAKQLGEMQSARQAKQRADKARNNSNDKDGDDDGNVKELKTIRDEEEKAANESDNNNNQPISTRRVEIADRQQQYQPQQMMAKKQDSMTGAIAQFDMARNHIMEDNNDPAYDTTQQEQDFQFQIPTQEQLQQLQEPEATTTEFNDIQAVEARMMEITQLLTQFSTLVADQQEEVIALQDSTMTAQDNMSRGQEQLVEAKERGKGSSHRMAKFVFGSGVVLVFLNWLFP